MSCSVAFNPFAAPTPGHRDLPLVIRSRSCPALGQNKLSKERPAHVRRKDPLVLELAIKLILTRKVEFQCMEDGTFSYCGKLIHADDVKTLIELKGVRVFQHYIKIFSDEFIPSGTMFLVFTTYDPVPKNFSVK